MVMSALEVSFMEMIVFVAGHAMPMRITNGMTVQMISTVVFSWNCSALCPTDLRCLTIEYAMAPNTTTKMPKIIHMISVWRS